MGKQTVFIIGSKGIPAKYGGFETFVDKLVNEKKSQNISYYVSCKNSSDNISSKNDVHCFNISVPEWIGPADAVVYDILSLKKCIQIIKREKIKNAIVYILACRIGPFLGHYRKMLKKLNCKIYVNPDGHEWKRVKWNAVIRFYWKLSERLMVKHSDLLICDSKNIEHYIQLNYKPYKPQTTFISYGADVSKSKLYDDSQIFTNWLLQKKLSSKNYYLIVGRFVPENNFETIIREFLKSSTKKTLAIITTPNESFLKELEKKTEFQKDTRIQFVGTVYNQSLLQKIREHAFAYIHGHEVGGTNPSLLEALASTDLNLLLDVNFNKEVAQDTALYWNKIKGSLIETISKAESLSRESINDLAKKSTQRIQNAYNWDKIITEYETLFLTRNDNR